MKVVILLGMAIVGSLAVGAAVRLPGMGARHPLAEWERRPASSVLWIAGVSLLLGAVLIFNGPFI